MRSKTNKPDYWGHVSNDTPEQYLDEALAEQYRRIHSDLILKWTNLSSVNSILKTDLYAEALCPSRAFLWDLMKENKNIIGIDVSTEIANRAKKNTLKYANEKSIILVNGDVRQLPFNNSTFDLIISDSTLDHFQHESEIIIALSEINRVLKPGGTLVITIDNKDNITEPLFRLWIHLGLAPFFIGKTFSIRSLIKALKSEGFHIEDDTAIIHNPRLITKKIALLLRKIAPTRSTLWISWILKEFDKFEHKKLRYKTAQFIAVKATKPS